MVNLAFRSLVVMGLLFGLLFAIGTGVLYYMKAPLPLAVVFAVGFMGVQFLISPFIIELIHKIEWTTLDVLDPRVAAFVRETCAGHGLREPRFGIIMDGNPNAFTFGHYPGNARVVVTQGLVDMLTEDEQEAVLAHELGHVVHWDFVVMTVAACVPLILYYIWRFGIGGRRSRSGGGAAVVVAIGAFVAYIISQYIVLFLSRVREYYADQFAAVQTEDPNAMATALVKIGYGLARAEKSKEDKEGKKRESVTVAAQGAKSLGIFDPNFGSSLALAAAGSYAATTGEYSTETTVKAMRWDIWNPWAFVCEIHSTHPLPARRLQQLDRIAERMGIKPTFDLPNEQPESYWDEFFVDALVHYLPIIGALVGAGVGLLLAQGGLSPLTIAGTAVLGLGLGLFIRVQFAYPKEAFPPRRVAHLVGEVKVSQVRAHACTVEGEVIGRGIPGLYWSEDLVVQDETGFIVLDYRQPLRLFEFLFGLFRADSFVGQKVVAEGWYRRFPRPFIELWKVRLPNGDIHTCHNWAVSFYGSLVLSVIGLVLAGLGVMGGI